MAPDPNVAEVRGRPNAPTEFADLARIDWVQVGHKVRLHAPANYVDPPRVEERWGGEGITVCGERGWLMIPGFFSRMGRRRCAQCCDLTGLPRGKGSPKNDDRCRALLGLDEEETR